MDRLKNVTRTLAAVAALLVLVAAAPRVSAQGSLVAWGDDSSGLVTGVPAGTFIAVAAGNSAWYDAGDDHAVAIRSNGTLASWGNDGYGQVSGTPAGTFSAVAAGTYHNVAIRTDGTIVAWGLDGAGEVSGPNADGGSFIAAAAGEYHTVAVRSDGTLVSWGPDANGQVSATPAGTFVAVAAAGFHSVAIRSDGTVVNWGGGIVVSILHENAPPAGTFSAVASNGISSIGLRTDGTLLTWWETGQEATSVGSFVAVAASSYDGDYFSNTFAIRADGTLAAWGDDSFGQVSGVPSGTYSAVAAAGGFCVAIATPTGNQPPVITCNGPVALWSPNHELVDVSSAISVSDPDGNPVTLTFRVFSDETEIPDTGDGTGRHAPDFKTTLASGATGLFLRSERRATENGRFYVVVVTADDGNAGIGTAVCIAAACPHDQNQPSLDDVLAQAAVAAAQVQSLMDTDTLPPAGQAPPGLYEHGLAAPQGPFQ